MFGRNKIQTSEWSLGDFEDEARRSSRSHSRKRTELKPSGMERSAAGEELRAEAPTLRRRRATAGGDIYIRRLQRP